MTADFDFTNPLESPDVFDALVIGGLAFSGRFEWSGDTIKLKTDKRHAHGRHGAHVRRSGAELAEPSLTLECYEPRHFEELGALVRLLFPRGAPTAARPTTQAAGFACAHPVLAMDGITMITPVSKTALRQTSPTKWTTEIKFTEYRPPVDAPGRRVVAAPTINLGGGRNGTVFTGLTGGSQVTPIPPPSDSETGPD